VDARRRRDAMIVERPPGLADLGDLHLGYCTNIHAGETWDEVFANVDTHVRAVKARVAPDFPLGVGLRLSAAASRRLAEPGVLESFRHYLAASGLYVFTINGFPYGAFSGGPVKERVYRPDWLEDERLAYSDQLAELLVALVPDGVEGSVSTAPGCFAERGSLREAAPRVAERLRAHAEHVWRLRERTGHVVTLALEPEPHCMLETSADAVKFFEGHVFSRASVEAFAAATGLAAAGAEETLRRHLGVCLDACHAAVEFEAPDETVDRFVAAGVRILKVQVSAGLRVTRPDAEALASLGRFAEGVYLHQVVVRSGAHLRRYLDLPQALADAARAGVADPVRAGDEWRIHFHVPVFREHLGPFENTQAFLEPLLARLGRQDVCRHLEVETYTWDVLPAEYRREPVDDAIARELAWTLERLGAPQRGAA
jgi:sugar phosphate isomerase/epimerase